MAKDVKNILPTINPIESDTFYETFGKGSRLELKNRGFNIDKLQLCFQKFDLNTNKQLAYISLYMDIYKALIMANDILSGRYATIAKKKQETKPGEVVEVYKNPGGQPAHVANRPDKKPLYREFAINKGKLWMLKATSGPGATTDNGGFVPDGKPDEVISIGLSDDDLKAIAIAIQKNHDAFLTAQYTLLALKSLNDKPAAKQSYGAKMNSEFDF